MRNYSVKSFIPTQEFLAFPVPDSALRLALLFQLEQIQWWKEAEIKNAQYIQIKKVLDHAYNTVPYYKTLWSEKKIKIPDKVDDDFFINLPILRRDDVQGASDKMVTTELPSGHGKIQFSTTSGSTGKPVRFGLTAITSQMWLAHALRDDHWHQRDFAGKLSVIKPKGGGVGMPPQGISAPHWGVATEPVYATGPSSFLNVIAKLSEQYDWLHREKPDYLLSLPSNLLALTDYILSQNLKFPKIQQLRTVSETLAPDKREYLKRHWNSDIVDMYTCEEVGYLALQCPQESHFHAQSENVLIEIVDDHNRPCPIGVTGRVLITSLNNFATPLIRYELGDYAEFGPPCPCGRGLPVIKRVYGRQRNRLIIPTDRGLQSVFPYLGEHDQIYRETGVVIHQFQCVQHSLKMIELKFVMDRDLTLDEQEKVTRLAQRTLGYPFEVTFTFLQDIPRGPNGKFEEFISLVRI